ncbi:MAG: hypothetical protein J0L80_01825 [Chitinophagales bacterium]|nr:hypothetical protein [Chitinophagales bacterium]
MNKTLVKNGSKNGTDTRVPAPQQAPTPIAPAAKPSETTKQPTLETIIQKAEELRGLTAKRQRTIETHNQIRTFSFSSDDNCVLTIADSQGHKFQTNNSNLINLLKDYFVTILADKVSALDDEILAFKLQ